MSALTTFSDGHWRDETNGWIDADDGCLDGDIHGTWASYVLSDQASLCGCIDDAPIMAAMIAYLTTLRFDESDLGQTLIANMADCAEFTEHGTSMRFPWLTDAGQRWLELANS